MQEQKRHKNIVERKVTRDQFHALIKKASQPIKESTVSDSGHSQTSAVDRSDGCNETRTHSDKTGDI